MVMAAHRTGGLVGKVSVITGVASGIGRATALAFALAFARAGALVVGGDQDEVGGRETARLISDATGVTIVFLPTDVTSGHEVARLI